MLMIGFLAGIALAVSRAKKAGENIAHIYNVSMVITISSLLGARIYFIMTHYNLFAESGLTGFPRWLAELRNMFWFDDGERFGGLMVLGGIIASTAAAVIYLKINKFPVLKYLDILAPSVGLGEFFTRIGCFLNGCCFGKPTSCFLGVVFPGNSNIPGQHLHPTQLYNSFAGLMIMFALLYIDRRKKFDGVTILSFFMLYSVGRFTIDSFRYYEPRMMVYGFAQSQILSIVIFLSSAVLMGILYSREKRAETISLEPGFSSREALEDFVIQD